MYEEDSQDSAEIGCDLSACVCVCYVSVCARVWNFEMLK